MAAAQRRKDAQRAADYLMQLRIVTAPHTETPQRAVQGLLKDIQRMTQQSTGVYQPDNDHLDRTALNALKKTLRG